MVDHSVIPSDRTLPSLGAVIALLKPITWFPPMWAYACGAVSVGIASGRWPEVILGVVLAGPLLCGTSQAINDWFDRHVDAINEPDRVIPSGRMPGRWGLWISLIGSVVSLCVASILGIWILLAAGLGLVLAWGYSMPPFRFKQNGWIGNAAVGFSYETLPWITAACASLGTLAPYEVILVALFYGAGAHGIMTLNDFKAIEGDRQMGVASLPVQLGTRGAARVSGAVMIGAQVGVIALLLGWGFVWTPLIVSALCLLQLAALPRFLADPIGKAVWYSGLGVGLYVTGMMATAVSLSGL
ncbi:chlorophyll synthase [Roseibium hamelinense]|uniref:Chlorophyll synthase n=1 Tax=Roseibium hamelinense TaxID=150831 RepID=A0A562SXB4_9HYPH|nr:chlorophyll synthase ChlG [Roseibium hamelinense]MTI44869.1 chlorophyll synthase ChlG [Roseibium hamelinense]TWI85937.1 chlorophyll synthase [Roseibium hamelinense]